MDPDVENGPPVSGADSKDTVTDRNTIPEDPERSAPPPPPGPESNASASNDFDERATEFWRVYTNEAQKYDEASIETWRADMKGIIIFAGLYSAVLTAFIVESKKKLTPIPSDEIAYYARQSVTLLAQVSAQLAASGSPVPSTVLLPPAFPDFRAAQADIRVNVYWFMSLVFSLSAALAATLVQQWAREYLQYFRRYNHPLRLARIRQFLHEGTESWHMDLVVHLVPSLIHISLFLFFIGLADYLFKINIATATTTTVVIVICALCYIFSIIAPIWDAQSPYQSPLSPMFWRLVYWRIGRPTKKEHNTGGMDKPIDTDIKEGRVQLAMKSSNGRIDRDERAIEWIIEALTEDSNLERLVRNIPGSFESTWGKRVLKAVIDKKKKEDPDAIDNRIARLLKTCTDPGGFPGRTEREQRASACIGASLSLVLSMDYEWAWLSKKDIPTMAQVLFYLSNVRKIRDAEIREAQAQGAPLSELDSTSTIRWTCMSTIVVHRILQTFDEVGTAAKLVIERLAEVRGVTEPEDTSRIDGEAAKTVKTIDKYLRISWDSANSLHKELIRDVDEKVENRVRNIMQEKKEEITALDDAWNDCGWAEETDKAIVKLSQTLTKATSGVLDSFPGAILPWMEDFHFDSEKGTQSSPSYFMLRFIPPRLLIRRLWSCVPALRRISSTGWEASVQKGNDLEDISAPQLTMPEMRKLMDETRTPMKTQLWRLQDLRSGGLVYSIELFIQAIKSSAKAALPESSELYRDTFPVIARRWYEGYEHGIWTELLLVDLLQRVLPPVNGDSSSDQVPEYIIDQYLIFLADMLKNKNEDHVEDAILQITAYCERSGNPEAARKALYKLESTGV